MKEEMSRRSFIKGAGAMVAGAAAASVSVGTVSALASGSASASGSTSASGLASASSSASASASAGSAPAGSASATGSSDGIVWEDEADVVIVGMGVAGMSCAAVINFEGLGTALMLEAAPQEMRGGNSSATGGIVFCPNSKEAALTYQGALNGDYEVPEDVFDAWAEEIIQNVGWLQDNFGCTYEPCKQKTWGVEGEFPFMPSAQDCPSYTVTEGTTWSVISDAVDQMGIPMYYDSRAIALITNEADEVIGVTTEDGRNFKADKGVLLATGGFEANADMMKTFLPAGYPDIIGKGSWYNRGDGIKMAQSLGANLWHMNNVSGAALGLKMLATDEVDSRTWTRWATHNYIFLDGRAQRFMDEDVLYTELLRHGKQYREGTFADSSMPKGAWAIFGQEEFDGGCIFSTSCFAAMKGVEGRCTTNQEGVDAGIVIKCDTYDDIAAATGLDVAAITASIDYYNGLADANDDTMFGRGQAKNEYSELISLPGHENDTVGRDAFDLSRIDSPYYVTPLVGTVLNTQGGPVRSANCEVIDVYGNPIPRLFAAGEMGCEYPYIYNVGGNISEGISSGRRAGRVICALDPVK